MQVAYWFKVNKKGYGWVPQTWQGYSVVILYICYLIYSFVQTDSKTHSVSDTLIQFVPRFLIFTALLIIITYLKGEPISLDSKKEEESKTP